MENDEFIMVTGKRARKGHRSRQKNSYLPHEPNLEGSFDLDEFIKRLNSCKQDVVLSDYFVQCYDKLLSCLSEVCQVESTESGHHEHTKDVDNTQLVDRPEDSSSKPERLHILSFGIGNFTSCLIARYQLAFLLALRDKLGAPTCEIYDPVFTASEKSVLLACQCEVTAHNEEGKRLCVSPTLAFLPHCGKALYNNLLWRNTASPGCSGLSHLVLLGNSFQHMIERTPRRLLEKTGSYVLKLKPFMSEVVLDNNFIHKDIFNDLAIHWFPPAKVKEMTSSFTEDCPEPVYDDCDAELIK